MDIVLLPKSIKFLGIDLFPKAIEEVNGPVKSKLCHVQSSVEIPFHLYQASPGPNPKRLPSHQSALVRPATSLAFAPANWRMKESRYVARVREVNVPKRVSSWY